MATVLTLNINGYGEKHGTWSSRRDAIVETIKRCAPDVIALQAVRSDPAHFGGKDQASQIAQLLGNYRHVWYHPGSELEGGVREGSAFIAQGEITQREVLTIPAPPASSDPVVRLVLRARFSSGLTVFNCHFSWVDEQNQTNVEQALPFFQQITGPALIVGDFNAAPDKGPIELIRRRGWTDVWQTLKPGEPGLTFEANNPEMRIDYAFADPDLRALLESIELVGTERQNSAVRLSDHLGLLVSVTL